MKTNLLAILLFSCFFSFGQLKPIGSWTDHLPYSSGSSITTNGSLVYCATKTGLFTYNSNDNSIERFSKVNLLNDINLAKIEFSYTSNALLIVYENSNIDIIKNNRTINLPFLKNSSQTEKTINEIKLYNNYAYLSMGFGVIVIDLEKEEIVDTYKFGKNGSSINVNSTEVYHDTIYAATNSGVFFADLNSNLLDFNSWSELSFKSNKKILKLFKNRYLNLISEEGANSDSVFYINNNTAFPLLGISGKKYVALSSPSNNQSIYYTKDETFFLDSLSNRVNSYLINNAGVLGGVITSNNRYFVLNTNTPLLELDQTNYDIILSTKPNGPIEKAVFDISVSENYVWGVNGRHDNAYSNGFDNALIYRYDKFAWENFAWFATGSLFGFYDLVSININPNNENDVFFGSWARGLLNYKSSLPFESYDADNSSLNERTAIKDWVGVGETEFDEDGNLWVVNSNTYRCLSVRKKDGTWKDFDFTQFLQSAETAVYDILVDENGYKWLVLERDNAIIVFDDNNTIDDISDDRSILLTKEKGKGALPGDRGLIVESDKNGAVWLGSSDGIAVHFNPGNIFESNSKDFERIIVPNGADNEVVLQNANITALVIDGDNRKWIGTDNSGVILLSEDGKETLLSFNVLNSPLFSNSINAIAVDDYTGEVYIATAEGLLSYRGTSTKGLETFSEVSIFPNPIRENYKGPITIQGLVNNSIIKITDINGTLINEIVSEGGTAIWDGNSFDGRRASSGVYLLFMSGENSNKSLKTEVGKIMFIN